MSDIETVAPVIRHKVPLEDGSFANTVVEPGSVVDAMYPQGMIDQAPVYIGEPKLDPVTGVRLTAVNSALRFRELQGGERAILGGTVTGKCAVAKDCGSCALWSAGLTTEEMSEKNCARANTAMAFERAEQTPIGRFMLLPTSKDAYVVSDDKLISEFNGNELLQHKLDPANAVVFTGSWLREHGLSKIAVGMHGADGSMGVATTRVRGELLIIPFCSMRNNMGDRGEEDQILRQALNAYFSSKGFAPDEQQESLVNMEVSITLAASASVGYFAHKIKIPRGNPEDFAKDEDPQKVAAEMARAALLRAKYPDLIAAAGGKLTSAIVLEDEFAGALTRGNIFPEFEAAAVEAGRDLPSPITPERCPGDGQMCNVHYRAETWYALFKQLRDMGVPARSVRFDAADVLDPSNPGNNAASNRREQNNGVMVVNTNRTLNGMVVELNPED